MQILEKILKKHKVTKDLESKEYVKFKPRQYSTIEDKLTSHDPNKDLPREEIEARAKNYNKDFVK